MKSDLSGRVANTALPYTNGFMPLIEAVVNSIQSINQSNNPNGEIEVTIKRDPQDLFEESSITELIIKDNGIGFNQENFDSFLELDSSNKRQLGCKGMGRLLWLKAFDKASIESIYRQPNGKLYKRIIEFSLDKEVVSPQPTEIEEGQIGTVVTLTGFKEKYQKKSPKRLETIAKNLLSHCIRYIAIEHNGPRIVIFDGEKSITLNDWLIENIVKHFPEQTIPVGQEKFKVNCLLVNSKLDVKSGIFWLADGRVVKTDDKFFDRHLRIKNALWDEDRELKLMVAVESPYLNSRVRPERDEFLIVANKSDRGEIDDDLTFDEIIEAIVPCLEELLQERIDLADKENSQRLLEATQQWPEFKPMLLSEKTIVLPRKASDSVVRAKLREERNKIADEIDRKIETTRQKLNPAAKDYFIQIDELVKTLLSNENVIANQSFLTEYVVRRKAVIDCFERALEYRESSEGETEKYELEKVIHSLIMPMKTDSRHVYYDEPNLWLLDDRMAFHSYLSSDLPIEKLPIKDINDVKGKIDRPDLVILKEYPDTFFVGDKNTGVINIVEFKRPGRSDSECINQVVKYANQLTKGEIKTPAGRPLRTNKPIFAYIILDISPEFEQELLIDDYYKVKDGYLYKYRSNLQLMIEVISFDEVVSRARERNYAFFNKLGIER